MKKGKEVAFLGLAEKHWLNEQVQALMGVHPKLRGACSDAILFGDGARLGRAD